MASRHILRSRLSLAPIPFPRGFRSCAYVLDSSRLQRASRIPVGAVETSAAGSEPQTTSTDVSKAPKTPAVPIDPNHVSIIKETLLSQHLDITSPTLRERIELHESSNENYTRRLEQTEKFQDTLLKRIQQLEITASENTGLLERTVKKQENLSSSLSGLNTLKNETLERVQAEHNSNLNRLRTVESKVAALEFGRMAIGERLEKIVEDHSSDSRTLSVLLDRIDCLEQDTLSLQDRLALTKRLMDQLSPSASQDLMKEIAEILQRFQKLVSTGACSDSIAEDINHLKREILGLTEFVTELSKIFVESMELSGKNLTQLNNLINDNQDWVEWQVGGKKTGRWRESIAA